MTGRCFLILGALSAAACAGTETGNPNPKPPVVEVGVALGSSLPEEVSLSPGRAPFVVEQYFWVLRSLQFTACSGEPVELAGTPTPVDLVQAGLAFDGLPGGTYCGLRLGLAVAEAGTRPEALQTHTAWMSGVRDGNVPFTIGTDTDTIAELAADGGEFTVADGTRLLLGFDVAAPAVASGVLIATPGPDGAIRIEQTVSDGTLTADFRNALLGSVVLYEDVDGDGAVGPGDPALTVN